ncbi:DUF748 domain-containing protein [Methyloversatilis sp. MC4-4]|uniref:DUF748 domain-containing protein n=1 Tax=Methyloversatilis sp. MC4-4 TaxID=3132824 RepID=UPI003CF354BC
MSGARARRRYRRAVLLVAALGSLLALYTALLALWLPAQIERRLPDVLQRQGIELRIGQLFIHPFRLTLEARDVALSSAAAGVAADIGQLRADIAWHSVLARRWQVSQLTLDGVDIRVQRAPAADPGSTATTSRKAGMAPRLPPLDIARATLTLRSLSVRAGPLTEALVLRDARAELADLSTAVGAAPARFRVHAPLPDDGLLELDGEFGPAALASQGRMRLSDANAGFWWQRLLPASAARVSGGRLDARAHYSIDFSAPLRQTLVLEALQVEAHAFELTPVEGGAPLLAVERLSIAGGRCLAGTRRLHLDGVRLQSGQLNVLRDAAGRLNWSGLTGPATASADKPSWRIELADTSAEQLALRYEDLRVPLRIGADHLTGQLQLNIATSPAAISASAIDAVLAGARLQAADAAPVGASALALQGAHLDSAARRLSARHVDIDGLLLQVELDARGRPALVPPHGASGRRSPATGGRSGWDYRVDELALNALTLQVAEAQRKTTLITLKGQAKVRGLARGADTPLSYSADLRAGEGRLRVDGNARQDGSGANARLRIDALPLDRMTPLLRGMSPLEVSARRLDADLRLRHGGRPALRVDGRAALAGLHLKDADGGETLLKAASVRTQGRLERQPGALHLARLTLEDAQGRIAIDEARQLNLSQIRVTHAPAPTARSSASKAPMPMRIDRLDIVRGTLDFSDDSLVLPFSARVTEVSARLLGVDNRPDGEATVEAHGRIQPHGEARAQGRVRPSALADMTDLHVRFDNIDMPLLSPYSATFAGRKIAAGKLWLDLRYRIRDRELDGLNIVTLQNVTLGDRVRAGGLTDSGLELALALLKDRDGRARVEVPVRGRVDDARILYRGVVADVIDNTVKRIVGAPFRLLGRLLGSEDALSGAIDFDPGSSRLAAGEKEKLYRLADALAQRPGLGVRLRPAYDANADGQALREATLRSEVAQLAGVPDDGGLLDFGDPAVQEAVARLHAARLPAAAQADNGDGAAARYRALFAQLAAGQPAQKDSVAALAQQRAEAVRRQLDLRGLDGTRIDIAAPVEARASVDVELQGVEAPQTP